MSHILIVLTAHDTLGDTGRKTGYWLEELAAPYYLFNEAGHELTLVSLPGGTPPFDPASAEPPYDTEETHRFQQDAAVPDVLAATKKLSEVDPTDFDAVFYPGGHGAVWDLAHSDASRDLIETFVNQDKLTAFVCHAPSVLRDVRGTDGEPLVKGRNVTGFSNAEERATGLTDVVPFLVEDALRANGGNYTSVEDWHPHVVRDGKLITGQNPSSSTAIAEELNAALAEEKASSAV